MDNTTNTETINNEIINTETINNETINTDIEDDDDEIINDNLRERKYPIHVLIKNICNLSSKTLLRWQTLDADFCKKYILNEEYQTAEDYYTITLDHILYRQPHLQRSDFLTDSDSDSD